MWTEARQRWQGRNSTGRSRGGRGSALALAAGLLLFAGCEAVDAPAPDESAPPAPPADEMAQPEPETVADIFPEGEGRELVLNNCQACHAVACAAQGQRTDARWSSLQEAHREHVATMTEDNLETAFTYLQENFGPDDPEPYIPPRFLQAGCTPF